MHAHLSAPLASSRGTHGQRARALVVSRATHAHLSAPLPSSRGTHGQRAWKLAVSRARQGQRSRVVVTSRGTHGQSRDELAVRALAQGDRPKALGACRAKHGESPQEVAVSPRTHGQRCRTLATSPATHRQRSNELASRGHTHGERSKEVASSRRTQGESRGTVASSRETHGERREKIASRGRELGQRRDALAQRGAAHAVFPEKEVVRRVADGQRGPAHGFFGAALRERGAPVGLIRRTHGVSGVSDGWLRDTVVERGADVAQIVATLAVLGAPRGVIARSHGVRGSELGQNGAKCRATSPPVGPRAVQDASCQGAHGAGRRSDSEKEQHARLGGRPDVALGEARVFGGLAGREGGHRGAERGVVVPQSRERYSSVSVSSVLAGARARQATWIAAGMGGTPARLMRHVEARRWRRAGRPVGRPDLCEAGVLRKQSLGNREVTAPATRLTGAVGDDAVAVVRAAPTLRAGGWRPRAAAGEDCHEQRECFRLEAHSDRRV